MPTKLALSGELTIRAIADAHGQLMDALGGGGRTTVTVSADAVIDLTLVQLLESGRRAAAEGGGRLMLAEPATNALAETLRRGGFLQTVEQRAFWLLETGEH